MTVRDEIGETARWPRETRGQAGRSSVPAIAVAALMNHVGQGGNLVTLQHVQYSWGHDDDHP